MPILVLTSFCSHSTSQTPTWYNRMHLVEQFVGIGLFKPRVSPKCFSHYGSCENRVLIEYFLCNLILTIFSKSIASISFSQCRDAALRSLFAIFLSSCSCFLHFRVSSGCILSALFESGSAVPLELLHFWRCPKFQAFFKFLLQNV